MQQLLIGLGNPGTRYEKTRHNAGFWFLDQLAQKHNLSFKEEKKFLALCSVWEHSFGKIYLIKPQTKMNLSGLSVRAVQQYYKLPITNLTVIHDELDILPGRLKIKNGGGHAGHNGLSDISTHLSSGEYNRGRIGIGRPEQFQSVSDYVLSSPSLSDKNLIDQAIDRLIDNMDDMIQDRWQKLQLTLHSAPE